MNGTMNNDVHLTGTSLRLAKGQRVKLIPATNQPDQTKTPYFARPLNGKWSDGIDHSAEDSILLDAEDVSADLTIECTHTDLQHDGNGWCMNGSWVDRVIITIPATLTDYAINRRIKSALGIQGYRIDEWSGSEWSWRSGSVGAYADVVPD